MSLKIDVTYGPSVTNLDLAGNAAYDPALYGEYTAAIATAVNSPLCKKIFHGTP